MWRIKYVNTDNRGHYFNNHYMQRLNDERVSWTKHFELATVFETWVEAATALFKRQSENTPMNWPYYRLSYRAKR